MFYLIYISSAVKLMEHGELLSLLEQSRENNRRLDITGMLLYKGGNFMQMLEGEKEAVLGLYDTICKDDRHRNVITIMTGETGERIFEKWSMGFCDMDRSDGSPRLDDYLTQELHFPAFKDDASQAYGFIVRFYNQNR